MTQRPDLMKVALPAVGVEDEIAGPEGAAVALQDLGDRAPVADVAGLFRALDNALEHVLTADVVPVLNEMRRVARPGAWFCFSICTRPSRITVRGENLHPTVRPLSWWVDVIGRVGVVNATKVTGRYITGRFK